MKRSQSEYPDISDLLALKASGRRQLAALSFAQKLSILDALKERIQPIVQARDVRGRLEAPATPGRTTTAA